MPESKGRKPAKKRAAKGPRKSPLPPKIDFSDEEARPAKPSRDPARELPEDQRYHIQELPEPATREQVLVALAQLDPMAQEVMIASRLAAMPSQAEGGLPVNIPRMVRGPWAHNLRKLGIFCIPELATHELVAPDGSDMMINHTAATLQSMDRKDMWEIAKQQNPELARLVDNAKTPEQKRQAMRVLASKMPVEQRMAVEKLMDTKPEDLEPV